MPAVEETTPVWFVKQTLVRTRTVMVQAWSEDEAREKAQGGYGEIIEQEKRYSLLCDSVEKDEG